MAPCLSHENDRAEQNGKQAGPKAAFGASIPLLPRDPCFPATLRAVVSCSTVKPFAAIGGPGTWNKPISTSGTHRFGFQSHPKRTPMPAAKPLAPIRAKVLHRKTPGSPGSHRKSRAPRELQKPPPSASKQSALSFMSRCSSREDRRRVPDFFCSLF